jgi:hypothetical protein
MAYWWVRFTDATPSNTYFGSEAEATTAAAVDGPVRDARRLPYPARRYSPDGCPPFCHDPDTCAGRGSCPKSYACSE